MIQIVYVSAAVQTFTLEALHTLLAKARIRNSIYDVTGMLLYDSGSFLQVLEGPVSGVDLIYASIAPDARHDHVKLLHRRPIGRREFKDWSMAFIDTSLWPRQASGMIDYRVEVARLASAPTAASRYIRLFQNGLCRQAIPREYYPTEVDSSL